MAYLIKREARTVTMALESDKDNNNTNVATSLGKLDVQASVEFVTCRVLAVATISVRVGVGKVTAECVDESVSPVATSLAVRRLEDSELAAATSDGQIMHLVGDKARY